LINSGKYYEIYAQNKYKGRKTVHQFTHTHTRKVYEYLSSIYVPSVLLTAHPQTLTTLERQNCNAVHGVSECIIYTLVF